MDKAGKVLKVSEGVKPFKLVAAPLKAYYALELPSNVVAASETRVGDQLKFEDEPYAMDIAA